MARKKPKASRRPPPARPPRAQRQPPEEPPKLPPGTVDQVERERRQLRVEQLARLRLTQTEIGARLKEEGFTTCSQPVVSRDLKEIRLRWKEERAELVDTEKTAGLDMLDHLQRLALEAFEASRREEVTERGGYRGTPKVKKGDEAAEAARFAERRTKTRAGDATFLRVVVEAERVRGDWLGFEAPKVRRLDLSTALRKLAGMLSLDPERMPQ